MKHEETIMVTGGNGMLGRALRGVVAGLPAAAREFVFVDIEDADLCDEEATEALFDRVRPTAVIHFAADVGGLYKNMAHGAEMFDNNIHMNMNIIRLCRKRSVRKLVSCLSTCIFPEQSLCPHIELPIDESMIHSGPPHPSNEAYAYAKRMLDVQSRYYRKEYGCNFICLAPTNIFGPNDNFSPEHSHVIPALIRKCHDAQLNGGDFVVWGSGRPLRQFVYSADLANLFMWAYENYDEAEPLILSPDEAAEVSIGTVAQHVADAFGFSKPLRFDTKYSDGQYQRTVTNRRLMSRNPSFRFTPLATAIGDTVAWFKAHHLEARL